MHDIRLETDHAPAPELVRHLGNGLNAHAMQSIGSAGFDSVAVWARNREDALVGGVQAYINWNWLHICLIWIDEPFRKMGLGTKLLNHIEAAGLERGCSQSHLDTFSFQARGFYERFGYELYGSLEDYPPGHSRYYLRKVLSR